MAERKFSIEIFIKTILIFGVLCSGISYIEGRLIPSYDESLYFQEDSSFPTFSQLGQIGGLAVDNDGKLHIFHRANRVWNFNTFDNKYRLNDETPITNDTIVVIDPQTGAELYSWGSDIFYMPHGIFVDNDGNTWVTDVALHQVLKFSANENKPSLTIGKKFQAGKGLYNLCQPTDVIANSGYIFVSDGYCNSRILIYDAQGKPKQEIGASDRMNIPHSLVLVPEFEAICVADRENRRILCYSSGLNSQMPPGILMGEIQESSLGRVYAIRKRGEHILAISNGDFRRISNPPQIVVFDIATGSHVASFQPTEDLSKPHCLAVSLDEGSVFVGEIDVNSSRRIHKFKVRD